MDMRYINTMLSSLRMIKLRETRFCRLSSALVATTLGTWKSERYKSLKRAGSGFILVTLTALLGGSGGLVRLDGMYSDFLAGWLAKDSPPDIVIVTVDDETLRKMGPWPISKSAQSDILNAICKSHPAAIGIDLRFGGLEEIDAIGEEELVATVGRCRSVVVSVRDPVYGAETPSNSNELNLTAAAAKVGHGNLHVDADGVVRSIYLRQSDGINWWEALGLAMLRVGGVRPRLPPIDEARKTMRPSNRGVSGGSWYGESLLYIEYLEPAGKINTVSYARLIAPDFDFSQFGGKFVVIGGAASGARDSVLIPNRGGAVSMPHAHVQANVLHALLHNKWFVRATPLQNAAFCSLAVIAAMSGLKRAKPALLLLGLPLAMVGMLAICAALRMVAQIEFAPTAALVGILVAYICWSSHRLTVAVTFMRREFLATNFGGANTGGTVESGDVLEQTMQAAARASRRVRTMKQFVHDCLDGLADGIVVLSREGKIVLANASARRWLGAERENGELREWTDIVDREFGSNRLLKLNTICLATRSDIYEVEVSSRHGRDYLIKCVSWRARAHASPALIVSIVDITDVRTAQRRRDDAMRFISHDLRAPQASILALLATWRETGDVQGSDLMKIGRIESYARRSLSLAEEFIQLARVEEHVGTLSPVDISDILVESIDEFWEISVRQNVGLIFDPISSECWCIGDRAVLLRAIGNLISNAMKYSSPGANVHCSIRLHDERFWELSIADAGPGIRLEDQERLFARYERLKPLDGIHRSGVGLGLAFVRAAAAMHSGTVGVASEPGQGARFYLRIPKLVENEQPVK